MDLWQASSPSIGARDEFLPQDVGLLRFVKEEASHDLVIFSNARYEKF